ncbi:TonB-dependent receptor [Weeksella sp. HMSC059D05]|uniref:TonB-dependent receptor domain-containing protein n=1 Tax=Weeksella sp. HMSC059D05 TaxID=1715139 RepID=UPI0008A4F042|nr:TonB-dependent receptor [Weeksella sp. HMSC059D05]OFM83838.1 TonB-dependent receptor [Weeksella sp. HMSC059D05]
MSIKNLSWIILSFFAINVMAQDTFKVTGKVTNNSTQKPIEFASVIIENNQAGYIAEVITNANGDFLYDLPQGDYLFVIEALGYSTIEKQVRVTETLNLGNIPLAAEEVISLQAATIVAEKPIYKVELDKKVYDMANDPMSQGQSLSDALQNVPSVQVDTEGNVSLRGNENVKFLIDGKPSGMLGISNPAEALKNIPSENVERVEVITNPSSRYEASGSAGIINIILKKGSNNGFNGSITANAGTPESVGANANLNYRTNKINLFTNFGFRYSKREGESSVKTTFYNPREERIGNDEVGYDDILYSYRETQRNNDRIRRNFNFRAGFEYYLDPKNSFTFSAGYRFNNGNSLSNILYTYANDDKFSFYDQVRKQNEDEIEHNIDADFNYTHKFDNKGHEFSVNARMSYAKEDEEADLRNFRNSRQIRQEAASSYENYKSVTISADYVKPIGEKGKFELGARGNIENTTTTFRATRLIDNLWTQIPGFNAEVDNFQNVYAAYTQYGNTIGKFTYFAGVRMEYSDMTIKDETLKKTINKEYVDWFPSATLNYEFNEKNQLQLSYSRRIRRPMSFFLLPYFTYSDDQNIRKGNPDINPTYTNAIELSYITNIGKLMITPNIYYQRSTDVYRNLNYNAGQYFESLPINLGTQDRYGLDLTFTYRPFRWWNLMGSINVFGYDDKGEIDYTYTYREADGSEHNVTENFNFKGDGISSFARLSSNFKLPADFGFQLAGMYRGKTKNARQDVNANISMDASLTKDILKGRGTFTLNVRDVFDSRKRAFTSYGNDFLTESEMRWNTRMINLSFTYRLKANQPKQRDRQNNMDDNGGMRDEMMPE